MNQLRILENPSFQSQKKGVFEAGGQGPRVGTIHIEGAEESFQTRIDWYHFCPHQTPASWCTKLGARKTPSLSLRENSKNSAARGKIQTWLPLYTRVAPVTGHPASPRELCYDESTWSYSGLNFVRAVTEGKFRKFCCTRQNSGATVHLHKDRPRYLLYNEGSGHSPRGIYKELFRLEFSLKNQKFFCLFYYGKMKKILTHKEKPGRDGPLSNL